MAGETSDELDKPRDTEELGEMKESRETDSTGVSPLDEMFPGELIIVDFKFLIHRIFSERKIILHLVACCLNLVKLSLTKKSQYKQNIFLVSLYLRTSMSSQLILLFTGFFIKN